LGLAVLANGTPLDSTIGGSYYVAAYRVAENAMPRTIQTYMDEHLFHIVAIVIDIEAVRSNQSRSTRVRPNRARESYINPPSSVHPVSAKAVGRTEVNRETPLGRVVGNLRTTWEISGVYPSYSAIRAVCPLFVHHISDKVGLPFGGGLISGRFLNLRGVKRFFFLSAALGYPQAAHEKEQPHAETTYDEVTHTNS